MVATSPARDRPWLRHCPPHSVPLGGKADPINASPLWQQTHHPSTVLEGVDVISRTDRIAVLFLYLQLQIKAECGRLWLHCGPWAQVAPQSQGISGATCRKQTPAGATSASLTWDNHLDLVAPQ